MMKSIKNIFLIISLVFVGILLFSTTSFANNCNEEEIKSSITKKAISLLEQSATAIGEYNTFTSEYEENCEEINERGEANEYPQDYKATIINLTGAQGVGATLINSDIYQNTGINWTGIKAKNANCKKLIQKANEALTRYNKSKNDAIIALGIYSKDPQVPFSCICPENSNQAECTAYTNDTKSGEAYSGKCKPFSEYLASLSSCPLCTIFSVILNTDSMIANLSWVALAEGLQKAIIAIFMAYLALETLKSVATVSGANLGSYLKTIMGLGLKVLITYFLLSESTYIYGYFISPVIKGGMDMGIAILGSSAPASSQCITGMAAETVSSGTELDPSLLNSIIQTVRCYGNSAAIMPAVGRGLICHGWENDAGYGILPDFNMWFTGVLLYGFGLGIWLAISFYLIDCTVQLGMVCAIVPVLVACWPFKITTSYSNKGVSLIMNIFFNYVMMGILLLIVQQITGHAAGGENGMQSFVRALNNNQLKEIQKITAMDGLEMLILLACCILTFKLIGTVSSLAGKFAKGSGSDIGAKMGGTAMSAAASVGKGAAKVGGRAAGAVADATGLTTIGNKIGNAGRNVANKGLSSLGKAVGLGKFQNKQRNGMPNTPNTPNGGGNGGGNNNGNQNTPNTPNGGNNDGGNNNGNQNTPNTPNDGGNGGGNNNNSNNNENNQI